MTIYPPMRPGPIAFAWLLTLGLIARGGDAPRPVDFNRDIRPILSNRCYACHGPDAGRRKGVAGPLRLDTREGAAADLGGYSALVPGEPEESELIHRVRSLDPAEVMPPPSHSARLSAEDAGKLADWIKQGGQYARHWSYSKPIRPAPPDVRDVGWPRNAVDRFLLARIEAEGLTPSPEADRLALIRRVTLDLTGLPPTWEQAEAFARDDRPDAYDRLVDRLLASPAHGEHQARAWLDLARYADSAGYADDPARTIWAYRDYVIRAFNANTPFDRMTLDQIAGDLLPDPTEDQLVATAFHRNTTTNNEGGTVDEEFRSAAVVDRVNTTLAVWMGSTAACAQCHDHKYDPISQADYFRLYAFFNNTEDADRTDESPRHPLFAPDHARKVAEADAEVARLEAALKSAFDGPELTAAHKSLDGLRKRAEAARKPENSVPILRELAGKARRETRIQRRGNYLDLGDAVTEGVPESIFPLPAGSARDRLALARWLVAEDNPLTARVVANRYWEQIFGSGLVPTAEDFGAQGEPPTHPELLDWLATELIGDGWDLKRFVRLLVTSGAYRQSSRVSADGLRLDPSNRWLARGPRSRLGAEAVRDQALAVAGLLSPKLYGPPVRPPQPASGLSAAFGAGIDWTTSVGEDRHRRGLYTAWRRSNPYPSMATFDAPSREVCTVRRSRTNTPLQALVTLNDPAYVEAAQAFARRIVADRGDRVRSAFRLALCRDPSEAEASRLARLVADATARFRSDPESARRLATDPIGPAPEGADLAELAAWTVAGNVLLNLDEFLMKR